MDKKVDLDQLGVVGGVSSKVIKKLDMDSADMETEDGLHLSSSPTMVDDVGFGLTPITPESNKESSDLMSCFTSPLSLVSHMNEDDNDDDDSPSTPKDGVFDPFAPGPDSKMLAPRSMKYLQLSQKFVERRLNLNSIKTKNDFEHINENALADDVDDMLLLEVVYDSLLECIISKQAEDILGEISAVDSSSVDALMTPFGHRLTGIAETCPNAPMKPAVKKSRYMDHSLCRKLELDFAI